MECVLEQAIIHVGRKTRASYLLLNFSLLCGAIKDQMWGEEMKYRGSWLFFKMEEKMLNLPPQSVLLYDVVLLKE